jgi:hypothetical protein
MNSLMDGLILSMAITPALIFSIMAIGGLMNGRLKIEPSQPWITFRDHPVKFSAIVSLYLIMALLFSVGLVRIASAHLR